MLKLNSLKNKKTKEKNFFLKKPPICHSMQKVHSINRFFFFFFHEIYNLSNTTLSNT